MHLLVSCVVHRLSYHARYARVRDRHEAHRAHSALVLLLREDNRLHRLLREVDHLLLVRQVADWLECVELLRDLADWNLLHRHELDLLSGVLFVQLSRDVVLGIQGERFFLQLGVNLRGFCELVGVIDFFLHHFAV